jgi:hypothetical protein
MTTLRNVVCMGISSVVLAGCDQAPDPGGQAAGRVLLEPPAFSKVEGWGRLPDDRVLGTVSGVAVDAQDNVWVLHRPRTVPADGPGRAAPAVVVFDSDGNLVATWGGPTTAYEWPQNEHGIHVDDEGFVWISGTYCTGMNVDGMNPLNDDHILKLTANGDLVMQIGRANQSTGNADTENFHRVAAMQVFAPTNEVFVADGYGNHRIIVLDADTGAYKRMWGAFGNTPEDEHRCGPQFFAADAPAWDKDQFSIVHGLAVSDDGFVYVADRENGRVQVFTLSGEYLDQIDLGADADPMTAAFSADEAQRYLYVWGAGRLNVYERRMLEPLATIADDPGTDGPGHLMAADSNGNLYIARLAGGIEKLALTSAAGR